MVCLEKLSCGCFGLRYCSCVCWRSGICLGFGIGFLALRSGLWLCLRLGLCLRHRKAVHQTFIFGQRDITTDHGTLMNQQGSVNRCFCACVVCHFVDVSFCLFAGIVGEVEVLALLQLVILGEYIIQLLWDQNGFGFNGLLCDFPAIGRQKSYALLVGVDVAGADPVGLVAHAAALEIDDGEEDHSQHQKHRDD